MTSPPVGSGKGLNNYLIIWGPCGDPDNNINTLYQHFFSIAINFGSSMKNRGNSSESDAFACFCEGL